MRALSFLGTLVAVVVVGFFGMTFAVLPAGGSIPAGELMMRMLGSLAAIASGISMFWRMKYPTRVLLVTAGLALVFPLDPFGSTLAFSWVVAKSPREDLYWAAPLAGLAVAAPLVRDWLAPATGTVLASHEGPNITVMTPVGYVVTWVVLLALAAAVGWARRSWGLAERAANVAQEKEDRVVELEGELTRQEERDLIAREMHDTVAHHLSLVSLHAGALEVTSDDPDVPEASKAVRHSAHQALEEMRTLIHSLRDSDSGGYVQVAPALSSLPALLADAEGAGATITSSFTLDGKAVDAQGLAGVVAAPVDRAAYRIAQEALTNALKHSPNQPVNVTVNVSEGVGLRVSNPLDVSAETRASEAQAPEASTGAGAGIVGIWERVETLGGSVQVGRRDGQWIVEVWLPR